MASKRTVRRMAGLIMKYFSDELLRRVVDPRSEQGRRWKSCLPLLKAVLLGLACGCKGLAELEELTAEMHPSVRKLLGIPKRIPDTTLRDFLCQLGPESLSTVLYTLGYDAWRRKALHDAEGFPWGVLSQDGKYPSIRDTQASTYLQVHHNEAGEATHGLLRTITSTLITAAGRPILGAVPVRGDTNEQGSFQQAFGDMVRIYGRLFRVVMYDAGAASLANADAVRKAGKHYFFQVADPRWVMYQTLEMLLRDEAPVACDEEIVSERQRIVRRLSLVSLRPTEKNLTVWGHARTAFKGLQRDLRGRCAHRHPDALLHHQPRELGAVRRQMAPARRHEVGRRDQPSDPRRGVCRGQASLDHRRCPGGPGGDAVAPGGLHHPDPVQVGHPALRRPSAPSLPQAHGMAQGHAEVAQFRGARRPTDPSLRSAPGPRLTSGSSRPGPGTEN